MRPRIPYVAWLLILALLTPVILGVIGAIHPSFAQMLKSIGAPNPVKLSIGYSSIFLCFLAGGLWAIALVSDKKSIFRYLLGLFPIAYLFSPLMNGGAFRLLSIALGYLVVLAIDIHFARHEIVPNWWVRFKAPLTIVMVLCLVAFQFRHLLSATFGYDVRH